MDPARLSLALESLAREMLRKAWIDFYSDSYDWVLEKAYRAATTLLAPHLAEPSLPLEALRRGCPSNIARSLQVLDYRRRLVFNPLLRVILGELETMPGRAEALDAIESVIILSKTIDECGGDNRDPVKLVIEELLNYGISSEATILLQGATAIIIRDVYTGIHPQARIDDNNLPRAPSLLLLAPDEAIALVHLPQGREALAGAEVLTDRAGVAHILL